MKRTIFSIIFIFILLAGPTLSGVCSGCGGDGEPICTVGSKCDKWRTPNPNYPNYCIACGGDGYLRCSVADSASPAPCRENRTINPNSTGYCTACGDTGQWACDVNAVGN